MNIAFIIESNYNSGGMERMLATISLMSSQSGMKSLLSLHLMRGGSRSSRYLAR